MVFSAHRNKLLIFGGGRHNIGDWRRCRRPGGAREVGDGDSPAELDGVQRQGCARQPDSPLGCGSFGNPRSIAARPARRTPSPSRAAVLQG